MLGLPGGSVVKDLPSGAGDMGSTPGRETKIPHALGQLSPSATTREVYTPKRAYTLQERPRAARIKTHAGASWVGFHREGFSELPADPSVQESEIPV